MEQAKRGVLPEHRSNHWIDKTKEREEMQVNFLFIGKLHIKKSRLRRQDWMNKKIKSIGYTLLSAGIAFFLYILLHEFGHMIVMLSVGATITDFSIFTAHVSADGGNYTDLSDMFMNVNGALLPLIISYLYTLLYKKDSTKSFYRIFSYMVTLSPIASMFAWVFIPFAYLHTDVPINDDVTKFLAVFCESYHPLIVSVMAVVLIGMGVFLMIKKRVIYNFIEEIKQK